MLKALIRHLYLQDARESIFFMVEHKCFGERSLRGILYAHSIQNSAYQVARFLSHPKEMKLEYMKCQVFEM